VTQMSRLVRAPRIISMEPMEVWLQTPQNKTPRLTFAVEVTGFNPNRFPAKINNIRWRATANGLTVEGEHPPLHLAARSQFRLETSAQLDGSTLPPNLINIDGTLDFSLALSMTATTMMGTIHFGYNGEPPLQSPKTRIQVKGSALPFKGQIGSNYLQVKTRFPKLPLLSDLVQVTKAVANIPYGSWTPIKVLQRAQTALEASSAFLTATTSMVKGSRTPQSLTPIAVQFTSPLGIPFCICGGTITVSCKGLPIGSATIDTPTAVGESHQSELLLHLVTEHPNLTKTLHQLRALATTKGLGKRPIEVYGKLKVKPAGRCLGRFDTIPFNLWLDPTCFR